MSKAELQSLGLKVTSPRLKILDLLRKSSQRHMSAEEIYQKLSTNSDIGLATVYRVLSQFEESGLLIRHRFTDDHSVFETNPDKHHDHMLCINCNDIVEFVDDVIEERQKLIAKKLNYKITDHSLYLYGICPVCQQKS